MQASRRLRQILQEPVGTSSIVFNENTSTIGSSLIKSIDGAPTKAKVQAFIQSFKTGEPFGLIELNKNLFGLNVREDIIARVLQYERSYDAGGTESTKSLSQVRGSAQKPFPGKGRGKARVSSIRAPQFRGGYNVHGPRPHLRTQDIQRKVYDLGIKHSISAKFIQNQMFFVDKLAVEAVTKEGLKEHLVQLGLLGKKILFVYGGEGNNAFIRSCDQFTLRIKTDADPIGERGILALPARYVSCKTLMGHEYVVADKEAVEILEEKYP